MAAGAAAAAALRRRRILSSGAFGVVVTVTPDDFARAIEMESEPVVVRSVVKHFWSDEVKKFRYISSVKGIAFFCESLNEVELQGGAIVIETEKLTAGRSMSVESLFLNASVMKLNQFSERIGICLGKLSEDQIWARGHENENAVGNLALHLSGNVRQWIMHGLGGQPDVRVRDREFSAEGGITPAELTALLTKTVAEATAIISALTAEQLTRQYEIQGRKVSGVEAVLNVVEHFAQHTGQIIYATKNLTGQDLGLVMPRK